MFVFWRAFVSRFVLRALRTLYLAVTTLSLPAIMEREYTNAGYVALVVTLYMFNIASLNSLRRTWNSDPEARFLDAVCSDEVIWNAARSLDCAVAPQVVTTAPPYNRTSGLTDFDGFPALVFSNTDGSRALSLFNTGAKDLAVYSRPHALLVHTAPTDYPRLGFYWIDPRPHQVLAYVYRSRFQAEESLFREYAHLDRRNFTRWAVDDPMEHMLAKNQELRKHMTIGRFQPRPEETAWLLASLNLVGFYVEFARILLNVLLRRLRARRSIGTTLLLESDLCTAFAVLPSTDERMEVSTVDKPIPLPSTMRLESSTPMDTAPRLATRPTHACHTSSDGDHCVQTTPSQQVHVHCATSSRGPALVEETTTALGPSPAHPTSYNGPSTVRSPPPTLVRCASSDARLAWYHQVPNMDRGPTVPVTEKAASAAEPPAPKRIRVYEATSMRPTRARRGRGFTYGQPSAFQPNNTFQ